jgi:hypothetical protein
VASGLAEATMPRRPSATGRTPNSDAPPVYANVHLLDMQIRVNDRRAGHDDPPRFYTPRRIPLSAYGVARKRSTMQSDVRA